jgi:hypothetical protein
MLHSTIRILMQASHTCIADWRSYLHQVPATVLQPGVLRATVPPHAPGPVRVAVSLGDGVPRSRLLAFEYRVPPPAQLSEEDRCAKVFLVHGCAGVTFGCNQRSNHDCGLLHALSATEGSVASGQVHAGSLGPGAAAAAGADAAGQPRPRQRQRARVARREQLCAGERRRPAAAQRAERAESGGASSGPAA